MHRDETRVMDEMELRISALKAIGAQRRRAGRNPRTQPGGRF
jgi:hypothetical protein